MTIYILRRVAEMIPVLLGITAIIFGLLRLSGDPVVLMLPEDAPREQFDQLREHLGLNRPLHEQYVIFLGHLVTGDFGESIRYSGQAVRGLVLERLPATLQLAAAALLVGVLISLPLGIVAALNRGRWPDTLASLLSIIGEAMPSFWLGIMLILGFSVQLGWLPVSGRSGLASIVLPAITLGTGLAAMLTRLMRSALVEVLSSDYLRTARAKGLPNHKVLLKHGLRNALISYVTVLGLQVASLMAGAVVTEQVFAWPGVGLLAVQAVNSRDMAVVQAVVIMVAVVVMIANLAVDVIYTAIDPRIRYT